MMNRREWMSAVALASIAGSSAADSTVNGGAALLSRGAKVPAFTFIYECVATIAPALDFGRTLEGRRRVIPITGGTFHGPRMRGQVVANGADWNLSRADGASRVDAAYYLKTDDQVLIRIANRGTSGPRAAPPPNAPELFFMYTHPEFEAPVGRYDWLNRGMFIGTLGARRGAKNEVLIRVFELT
jgi:uncharacterized protein DUF3237